MWSRLISEGYVLVPAPKNHPRAHSGGRMREHVLVVERAFGRTFSEKHPVHHANGDGTDNRQKNLVLCENQAYHNLLHRRQRALGACGHPDWLACRFCKEYDAPIRMYVTQTRQGHTYQYHRSCSADYARRRRRILA